MPGRLVSCNEEAGVAGPSRLLETCLQAAGPSVPRISCQRKLAERLGLLFAVTPLETLAGARKRIGLLRGLFQRSETLCRSTRPLRLCRLERFQLGEHVDSLCIAPRLDVVPCVFT